MGEIPVIIDTDGGVDDAFAIIYAVKSSVIDIKAVTAVSGNTGLDQVCQNISTILSLSMPGNTIPIGKGEEQPLEKPLFLAESIHGKDGLGDVGGVPHQVKVKEALPLIFSMIDQYPNMLTIVAIGPLTNIAKAIQTDPRKMNKVKQLVIMGGAYTVPGNISAAAEFNFFVDPHAAQIVMESGIPLTLVGLDIAEKAPLTREKLIELHQKYPSPLSQWIIDISAKYMNFYRDQEQFDGCFLHDPLAVAIAEDPSLAKMEAVHVVVETDGRFTSGLSLADFRRRKDPKLFPPNAQVCLELDQERFYNRFYSIIWEDGRDAV